MSDLSKPPQREVNDLVFPSGGIKALADFERPLLGSPDPDHPGLTPKLVGVADLMPNLPGVACFDCPNSVWRALARLPKHGEKGYSGSQSSSKNLLVATEPYLEGFCTYFSTIVWSNGVDPTMSCTVREVKIREDRERQHQSWANAEDPGIFND